LLVAQAETALMTEIRGEDLLAISQAAMDLPVDDPVLRARAHQQLEQVQSEIAAAVARDTGAAAEDAGPQTFAGAAMASLFTLRAIGLDGRGDAAAQTAAGLAFLRGGLATLG